jgi:hypothetical protein
LIIVNVFGILSHFGCKTISRSSIKYLQAFFSIKFTKFKQINHLICKSNFKADSFSNFGASYKHPQYDYGSAEAQKFLAGSKNFLTSEIEVYQVLNN